MAKVIIDRNKINEVLTRGVENIFPSREALEKVLLSGRRIRLYCGFDPSRPSLHIGNAVLINKLSQFQELGHEVIFLIGDFTGMIGDPTDKSAARKRMTRQEVRKNSRGYKKQASGYLKFSGKNPARILYNSQWSDKITFKDLINITSNFTVQQMIQRDMFEKRFYGEIQCKKCQQLFTVKSTYFKFTGDGQLEYAEGITSPFVCSNCGQDNFGQTPSSKPIYLHEFLYPVAQGYDSVAMDVDLEIGGSDQMFNMLCGRDLVKIYNKKEKFVLTMKLLADDQGKKMGKSEGNAVFLDQSPADMYGAVMSWSDGIIAAGFELATKVPMVEIENIKKQLRSGQVNPRDLKMKLAFEIVKINYNLKAAEKAEKQFIKTFQEKETPEEIAVKKIKGQKINIVDLLVKVKFAVSRSEAKRLIMQRGIRINGQVISDINLIIEIGQKEILLQRGKRQFIKIFGN